MIFSLRRALLRDLPEGAIVKYTGPSSYLYGRLGKKICHRSNHMKVAFYNGEIMEKIKYQNLTCEAIESALHCARVLQNDIDPDPELPF